jgi:predicted flap endonuclease-1-like 5' DNA nuclease
MSIPIKQLRGLTANLRRGLRAQGIYSTEQLLEAARTPIERTALAARAGVEPRTLLALANRADLSRIRGVAGTYSDLLEQAGVDTVRELATRNPDNLYAKLQELNTGRKLVGHMPPRNMVRGWIAQAKDLPRRLEY